METRQILAANRKANLSFGGLLGGIGRGIGGLIPGVSTAIGVIESFGGRRGGGTVARGPGTSVQTTGCGPGLVKVGTQCIDITAVLPGGRPFTSPTKNTRPGGATGLGSRMMGGFEPEMVQTLKSDCGPKHVLGADGLCYPKRGFPNRDRMWPKGRAPLLTGGERNAITKASRAAKKIERTTKQLQRLGMIKKPNPRRRVAAPRAMRQLGPGPSIINVE